MKLPPMPPMRTPGKSRARDPKAAKGMTKKQLKVKRRGYFDVTEERQVRWHDPEYNAEIYGSGTRKMRAARARAAGLGPNPKVK